MAGDAGNIDVIAGIEKGIAQVCELLWACAYAMNHHNGFGGSFAVGFNNRSDSGLTSVFEASSLTVRFAAAMASS